jgi:metal-responsive CopG/Arc/MetJ family transcriptional regulator
MGYAKVSVTIPQDVYEEIKNFSSRNNVKLSRLVTEAISDKLRRIKEEALIDQINKVYDDPEVSEEQRRMAESIADNTDVEELPW